MPPVNIHGLLAACGGENPVPLSREDVPGRVLDHFLVIHNKDRFRSLPQFHPPLLAASRSFEAPCYRAYCD